MITSRPPPDHRPFMQQALTLAAEAGREGEVPVGAVLVKNGHIIATGRNSPIHAHDPTCHAEINAIRAAAATMNNYRLPGTTLYVTLEPCIMCAGAIIQARIDTLVFAAWDTRSGAAGGAMNLLQSPLLNHQCRIITGIDKARSEALLRRFFYQRRSDDR